MNPRHGCVRRFRAEDIPEVARIHQRVFRPVHAAGADRDGRYGAYFTRVFLETPVHDPALSSLVYEDDDGRVRGFLGVVPKSVRMNGRRYQAVISSQFVVDPEAPVGLVAIRLARTFFDGPQDLSISDEATDASRRIWEGLGGSTALLRSLHWTRPLKPARLALSLVSTRGGFARLAAAAAPVAVALDALTARALRTRVNGSAGSMDTDALDEEAFMTCQPAWAGAESLQVEYDERGTRWLLERARERKPHGRFEAVVLRQGGRIAGWFVYHLEGGIAETLQIAGAPGTIDSVLRVLFSHAQRRGAVAVNGRVEPRLLHALAEAHCFFHRRGPWMLVHTRRPELLHPFETHAASFSRLDGEWCLGF